MKKRLLSILLAFSLSFCLLSCNDKKSDINDIVDGNHPKWNFYPEGYTGGFPGVLTQPGLELEIWWLETYEECLAAIKQLRSHGSTFCESSIIASDGVFFDTKYSIEICWERETEKIKYGDNPFDRHATSVRIYSYVFYEDVTVDEISYGDIKDYHVYSLYLENFEILDDSDSFKYDIEWRNNSWEKDVCYISFNRIPIYKIGRLEKDKTTSRAMSDEHIDAIINSTKIITESGNIYSYR